PAGNLLVKPDSAFNPAGPDHIHRELRDDIEADGARPSSHPAALQISPPLPSRTRNRSERIGRRAVVAVKLPIYMHGATTLALSQALRQSASILTKAGGRFGFHPPSDLVMTANARPISPCNSTKSARSNDFFGLMTTSNGRLTSNLCSR